MRFSVLDGVVCLRLDDKDMLDAQLDEEVSGLGASLCISAEGCDCVLSDIRILKDNYYTMLGRETKIAPGHYFFLADNSSAGKDSRYLGPIPEERIIGRVTGILFSSDR